MSKYKVDIQETARQALKGGYGVMHTPHIMTLELSGDCTNPLTIELWGRANGNTDRPEYDPTHPVNGYGLNVMARCRKCDNCIKYRARLWAGRAMGEAALASRIWFGTLTYHPHRFIHLATRSNDEKFNLSAQIALGDVTRYLKRIRKAKAKIRYMYVVEPHKTGLAHVHMLMFEQSGVTKRLLETQWKHGFSQWRLCVEAHHAAMYCAKYASKSGQKLRASSKFGKKNFMPAAPCTAPRLGAGSCDVTFNDDNGRQ